MAMCEKCGKRPATVQVTQTINHQTKQMVLCADCAREEGVFANPFMPLAQMMAGMMGESVRPQRASQSIRCSHCGFEFARFKETGLLGCPQCYSDFSEYLNPMIRRIQGSLNHLGERPGQSQNAPADIQIQSLKKQLAQAIDQEEYEKAAAIRDQIRTRQEEDKNHGTVE